MTTDANDYAYPSNGIITGGPPLTKRELFAAMAMQGYLSNSSLDGTFKQVADSAVLQADALIEALNEGKEKP